MYNIYDVHKETEQDKLSFTTLLGEGITFLVFRICTVEKIE